MATHRRWRGAPAVCGRIVCATAFGPPSGVAARSKGSSQRAAARRWPIGRRLHRSKMFGVAERAAFDRVAGGARPPAGVATAARTVYSPWG
jgi:hypothetical protein